MTADALKSLSITDLDATPVVQHSAGQGAPGQYKQVSDTVTPTAAGIATIGSKYTMVRVPTNCKLKNLRLISTGALDSNGSPLLTVDVGAYYSDSTVDGTASANQGTAVNAGAIDFADAVAFGDAAHENIDVLVPALFGMEKRNKQLWDALGLTSDPGGYFDIVVTVEAAAATGVSVVMGMEAFYVW